MCDDQTLDDENRYLQQRGLTRRRFGQLAAAVPLAGCATSAPSDLLYADDVRIATPDGVCDAYFVHPVDGRHPAVLIWPDVLSLRPAFRTMADRLAGLGYAVLVINPYYRSAPAPVVQPGASFQDEATRNLVLPLARQLSYETNITDARAFVAWLDSQDAVDTTRGIATTGYCMGGPITVRAAAALPDRIKAAASFHGGRLVTDAENSPHRLIARSQARFLFAIAENDDEREPGAKDALRDALSAAGRAGEVEVYPALHGWCVIDSRVYNEGEAERAWGRMLALFDAAL